MSENQNSHHKAMDLKAIGEILRNKREEHSYTLEHVSEITRISLTSLKSIEEGNMDSLPGLVFVRGFVRNYAKLLGLDSEWMTEALNQAYGDRIPGQPVETEPEGSLETTETEKGNTKMIISGIALAAAILIILFIYWNLKSIDRYSVVSEKVETVEAIDSKESPVSPAEEPEILKPTESKPAAVEPEPAKPEISPLTLTLVAMKNEWIQLEIDHQEPVLIQLNKGETYEWPAQEDFSLVMTTGNTAKIWLNGEEILERENYSDQLYRTHLDKFTLTQINN